MPACHGPVPSELFPEGRPERLIAFAGNPNVGKSTLFNSVTGQDVITAHYAGKTVDVNVGHTVIGEEIANVIDLPGTYGLDDASEVSLTTRRALLDLRPDATIVVLDASNLTHNLALAFEVLDLGLPVVLAANIADVARRAGTEVDAARLAAATGARVIETVAVTGEGISDLMTAALEVAEEPRPLPTPLHRYTIDVETSVAPLIATVKSRGSSALCLEGRPLALQLLEGRTDVIEALEEQGDTGLIRVAAETRVAVEHLSGGRPSFVLHRERHTLAKQVADECISQRKVRRQIPWEKLATAPLTGIPMLIAALASIFLLLFFVGEFLAGLFSSGWAAFVSPHIQALVGAIAGDGVIGSTLLWGLDSGIEAALGIGLPYILTFYFLLAILEDSGYLNAVAFLSDNMMHRLGLHGRAIIPLVAGAGCSVPAVLSTRVLSSDRERFIAATLVSFVPCSARTAVILGAVGHYIGIGPALGVYAVTVVVTITVGAVMARVVPGQTRGLVMEMFAFRRPKVAIVARKAWGQFVEFLVVVIPLVVVGSIVLGGLYESGWLWSLTTPLDPLVVGLLGLPSVAGLTLLFGVLRKEFALQLLVTLAIASMGEEARDLTAFMSSTDLFVYALVNTLAIPCISTIAVLGKVLGRRRTALVVAITVGTALGVGAFFARAIPIVTNLLG
ncbi:MAG: ferrous iron transport protein B [Coriobacteriia bacterium]|nr:ferrous iron transport protein B [Coriobacteriia bacterium]